MSEEETRAYMKAYYRENREKLRSYGKKWWAEHRDEQNAIRRAKYRKNALRRRQSNGLA